MKPPRFFFTAALGAVMLFPACASWIYGEYVVSDENVVYAKDNTFTAVNASLYTAWVYVDLAGGKATRVVEYGEESLGDSPPGEWHFAMHRFECKTNGGEVLETPFQTIESLLASGSVPTGDFVADIWTDDVVPYDLSQMMTEEIILYAETDYNPELSKWMDVDLSDMPPTYTPSNKVYLLRFADGTMAAVRFTGFIGPSNTKGYNSFEYRYPIGL